MAFVRGDSPRYALDLTGGQWSAIGMMLIALGLMVYLLVRHGFKTDEKQPETS